MGLIWICKGMLMCGLAFLRQFLHHGTVLCRCEAHGKHANNITHMKEAGMCREMAQECLHPATPAQQSSKGAVKPFSTLWHVKRSPLHCCRWTGPLVGRLMGQIQQVAFFPMFSAMGRLKVQRDETRVSVACHLHIDLHYPNTQVCYMIKGTEASLTHALHPGL
eukprot:1158366-Pelagomonas_calceolata.AAC.7